MLQMVLLKETEIVIEIKKHIQAAQINIEIKIISILKHVKRFIYYKTINAQIQRKVIALSSTFQR